MRVVAYIFPRGNRAAERAFEIKQGPARPAIAGGGNRSTGGGDAAIDPGREPSRPTVKPRPQPF